MKILLVKSKNLHSSACLNLNYGTIKQKKNLMIAKMVELVKTYDQYPCKLNFGHFFSSIILTPLSWGGNRFSENAVWVKWVKRFIFYSQMYLPVSLTS